MSTAYGTYDDCGCKCASACCAALVSVSQDNLHFPSGEAYAFASADYPNQCPPGPPASNQPYFLNWNTIQTTNYAPIAMPQTISLGGLVDLTFSTENGRCQRRTNSGFPVWGGALFCADEALAFFSDYADGSTPEEPQFTANGGPGGPVVIEFNPPICMIEFAVFHDAFTFRDDLFIEVWTNVGGYEGIITTFADYTATPVSPPSLKARICGTGTRRITKIRFGFAGSGPSGAANIPFVVGTIGVCV